ncbi:MAG: DUF1810 domain-containing protein, partial [Acidobacteriota bacterium]
MTKSPASPAGLERFLVAQMNVYPQALAEIRAGRKRSHWMWFVFPQIAGLGRSEMAQYYAIRDRREASEYLDHPILGARLREISSALLSLPSTSALEIFGDPDHLKLHSSLTLFATISPVRSVFSELLD